jgi:hypothetical protein
MPDPAVASFALASIPETGASMKVAPFPFNSSIAFSFVRFYSSSFKIRDKTFLLISVLK